VINFTSVDIYRSIDNEEENSPQLSMIGARKMNYMRLILVKYNYIMYSE
jgi:hypothetical protein